MIGCFPGDSQLGFWGIDNIDPIVNLIGPGTGTEDSDGIVDFTYIVTDANQINNCSLYLDGILEATDTSITKSVNQQIKITNIKQSDSIKWHISCWDNFQNQGNSSFFYLDTKEGGGSPLGGGGSITNKLFAKSLGIENIDIPLCNLTYYYLLKHGQSNNYYFINDINKEYFELTDERAIWTTTKTYLDNWQPLCSDNINRTLDPILVCNKIYYFIVDKGYKYTNEDLFELEKEIKEDLEISPYLLDYYLYNHDELCYETGYSDKLPRKPLKTLTIAKKGTLFDKDSINECNETIGINFFDWSIPFIEIHLNNLYCNQLDSWRWIFKLEQKTENGLIKNYSITGIKIWFIMLILTIMLMIYLLVLNKKTNIIKKRIKELF